ncbi:hypothetical protein PVAP13_2KG395420 [Panicum virgatum]|uniref:Uncharacterized protein n=1 Tax=Panicum virgatum TaxID=38727 RepID=A0A8T0WL68_PANVG|nr:hypothetical protein PVAP13_2KG395420 [Panicum virgatum]
MWVHHRWLGDGGRRESNHGKCIPLPAATPSLQPSNNVSSHRLGRGQRPYRRNTEEGRPEERGAEGRDPPRPVDRPRRERGSPSTEKRRKRDSSLIRPGPTHLHQERAQPRLNRRGARAGGGALPLLTDAGGAAGGGGGESETREKRGARRGGACGRSSEYSSSARPGRPVGGGAAEKPRWGRTTATRREANSRAAGPRLGRLDLHSPLHVFVSVISSSSFSLTSDDDLRPV